MDSKVYEEVLEGQNAVDFIPEMEKEWLQFEKANRLNEPPAELLRERWYRQKFRLFVNKWLTDRWVIPPKPLGNEDYVFAIYPDIEKEWIEKRDYLKTIEPSDSALIQSWLTTRKLQFQNRWLKINTSGKKEDFVDDIKVDKEIASFCHLRKNFKSWFLSVNNVALIEFLSFLCGVIFYKYHV